MMRFWIIALAMLSASIAAAQEIEVTPLEPLDPDAIVEEPVIEETVQVPTLSIDQVILRGIDKLDGTADDIVVEAGVPQRFGLLDIELKECRYPEDNPTGEAFAYLVLREADEVIFSGWMVASSPALNALDHQRYDIWVQR
jgi:hypothetical protein